MSGIVTSDDLDVSPFFDLTAFVKKKKKNVCVKQAFHSGTDESLRLLKLSQFDRILCTKIK